MKVIAIGRNYIDHAKELNNPVPTEPVVFLKPDTAVTKGNKPFFYPDFSSDIHYEAELVLKIGKVGKNIDEKFAHRYFDEITVGIDFTARDLQQKAKANGLPWEKAKAFDGSAPIGRFLKKSEFTDFHTLTFGLMLNGHKVQNGTPADMIFTPEQLLAYVSKFFTLQTGDLLFTGTPAGVGPVSIGDRLQADIDGEILLDFLIK